MSFLHLLRLGSCCNKHEKWRISYLITFINKATRFVAILNYGLSNVVRHEPSSNITTTHHELLVATAESSYK